MSSSTTCSVVDDYAVLFDGALYIRKVNKNATREEKKQRRAQYMKRYRSGRKAVKNTQKEQQAEKGELGISAQQQGDDTGGAQQEKAVGNSAQQSLTGSARE